MKNKLSPQFFCIGAPKAGTAWLYTNLQCHPEIWLPPIKSIQYFSGRLRKFRRKKFKNRLKKLDEVIQRGQLTWYLKYFLHPFPGLNWYRSLFQPAGKRVSGEVSPFYSTLGTEEVKQVRDANPQLKIVYLLRNPLERMWSHARMSLMSLQKRTFQETSEDEFIDFFQRSGQLLRTDYIQTLKVWKTYFPASQIFIGFYDSISEDPGALLSDICRFLGIDDNLDHFNNTMFERVHVSSRQSIPDNLRAVLTKTYGGQMEELHLTLGGYATKWWQNFQKE